MNIWLSLDQVENANVDELRETINRVQKLSGKEYNFYSKVYPTHIGTKVMFVCEELDIDVDITNYNNW